VALALASEPLYLELYFACARLGAICVPLNTRLTAPELRFQIQDCSATLLIHSPEHPLSGLGATRSIERAAFMSEIPERAETPPAVPGGETPQVIMYTSGTTGVPKGAVLPHRKTLYNTLNAQAYFGLSADDVGVVPIPLFHSFGLKILSVPLLYAGATIALVDKFDPVGLQETLASERATLIGAVPVMYRRMMDAGLRPELWQSLRFAFSAGAALEIATIRALHEIGVPLMQGYGQTETSILCCLDAEDALKHAGSVGRPVKYGQVRVGDEQGRILPSNTRGEVLVRGPIVMSGYWNRPEETAAAQVDGWHRTGDLGVMDEDGLLTLVGRLKELYISGGENVYPAEIERVLEAHPNVSEVAVMGVADPRWGEAGRAFVVPVRRPLDAEALLEWAGERLARYKLPRDVIEVEQLPRTASGKVQKHVLESYHPN
jgi:fatty-acyl-CoA synthase